MEDFNFSAQIEGQSKPFSNMMYLSRGREATLESYFDPLVYYIEQFMITGKEHYPVERVLLANGILCAATREPSQWREARSNAPARHSLSTRCIDP